MNKQGVIWKSIENYSDYYEISSSGLIRSKDRIIYDKNGIRLRVNKAKEIKQRNGNYKTVGLNKGGVQKPFTVHRLVALHFVPNPDNKNQINHKDGDKDNNNDWNLEWCTCSENIKHAFKKGLKKPTWLGKKLSEETRSRMSESMKGRIPHNKGKKKAQP